MSAAPENAPPWLAALREHHARTRSLRLTGQSIGYCKATVSLVLRGRYMADTQRIEAAVRERIGVQEPAWLAALRAAAAQTSQARVAQLVGLSETTISQVLTGSYRASTLRVERRVAGQLCGATCPCPVMGEVSTRVCQDVQERQLGKGARGIANPQHAMTWHACRGSGRFTKAGPCPHFNGAGAKPSKESA